MVSTKSSGSDNRTRTWTFIVYPESAPDNWRDIIDDMHIEWVCSPLHDKDINATGEPKKPHWHVLVLFDGKKSYEQIKAITDSIGAPVPQRCHSAKGAVRYMAHLDNPEKAQYDILDIKSYGGVDLAELLRPTSSDRYSIISDMIEYVKSNNIIEFQDLMDYARSEEFEKWFPLLCDNSAYIVNQYIKSQRHRQQKIDIKTGEVIE